MRYVDPSGHDDEEASAGSLPDGIVPAGKGNGFDLENLNTDASPNIFSNGVDESGDINNRLNETFPPGKSILVVGEDANFSYSRSLSSLRPNLRIIGTKLGNALVGTQQETISEMDNLTLIDNVDATKLNEGLVGLNEYDAIVFNNPFLQGVDSIQTDLLSAELIARFVETAQDQLKPGGEVHINVTKSFLKTYNANSASYLGTQQGTFGTTEYYAPFTPHYSNGTAMNFYRSNPNSVTQLINFVFK